MRIHPRTLPVQNAQNEVARLLIDWEKKHDLTTAEVVKILAGEISMQMKYAIRTERHGRADKKGDEA